MDRWDLLDTNFWPGRGLIEFRERKPYWKNRLEGKDYDVIKFRNGYALNAPEMVVEFLGVRKDIGKYEIQLGRVLSLY